ncbi:MAG: SIS domain-containing protein [Planctomycetota bacterium]|nr:SIS domain-containing protein [Planctomycetota bacterium]MDA0919556.1 SIS domain-containing protein [Planctomycetota bacterium]MDA1160346.1 SIS domain-containing protein [Planctomycetota bacterium]
MSAPFEDSGWATDRVRESFGDVAALADRLRQNSATEIVRAAELVYESIKSGHKILACGNGGSAAEAQHFVAELVGRFLTEREPLAGVALTVDTSVLTAIGNDYGYEEVFARQVRAIGQPDDVLLAISTSGQSPNVLAALAAARDRGLTTIALVGAESNPDLDTCEQVISIPDSSTARIQEMHLVILHLICDMVDIALEADSLSR